MIYFQRTGNACVCKQGVTVLTAHHTVCLHSAKPTEAEHSGSSAFSFCNGFQMTHAYSIWKDTTPCWYRRIHLGSGRKPRIHIFPASKVVLWPKLAQLEFNWPFGWLCVNGIRNSLAVSDLYLVVLTATPSSLCFRAPAHVLTLVRETGDCVRKRMCSLKVIKKRI